MVTSTFCQIDETVLQVIDYNIRKYNFGVNRNFKIKEMWCKENPHAIYEKTLYFLVEKNSSKLSPLLCELEIMIIRNSEIDIECIGIDNYPNVKEKRILGDFVFNYL